MALPVIMETLSGFLEQRVVSSFVSIFRLLQVVRLNFRTVRNGKKTGFEKQ